MSLSNPRRKSLIDSHSKGVVVVVVSSLSSHSNEFPNNGTIDLGDGSSSSTCIPSTLHTTATKKPRRTIAKIEKFARLPVWPVWQGVLIFLISKVFGEELGAKLEDMIGGRVCPNFFQDDSTSPFLMLVHHRHSFVPWDLLRYPIRSLILPEGFPAHPHRGFITVTYCMKGGMIHRDSLGIKQVYGAESRHQSKDVQWLTTGAGILHEEMWDIDTNNKGIFDTSDQELYQLWLNVPASSKLCSPKVELLGKEEMPVVASIDGLCTTKVIAGEYHNSKATVQTLSSLNIFHVQIKPGGTWEASIPDPHRTGIIYMRQGSVQLDTQRIPPHHTAYLDPYGSKLILQADSDTGADFLLLTGAPLREPVSAQGSMVMNDSTEINQAYQDYSVGKMGRPWDHNLSDEDWKKHVMAYPSEYNHSNSS